jgi:hypothetical protein
LSEYEECFDVSGGPFCEALVYGEYCADGELLQADDVSRIQECMAAWGEDKNINFDECTVWATYVADGFCDEYASAYDRLRECLEIRGPQSLRDGECFLWLAKYDGGLIPGCPWWESYECLEMYIEAT